MSKNNENTSSDKEFLNLIKPNEERRRIKNIGIIFWILIISIVSICSGFIFNLFFIFNIETFYWVTSAIIQAFGAMLAIVISIAIYRMQTTENQTSDITEKLMKLDYKEENKGKITTIVIDLLKGSLQTLEDLRTRMSNIIISMGFLVVMALLMIFFTKINLKSNLIIDNNLLISIGLSFIIFYAIYCVIILVYELHALMEWKRRVDFLFPGKKFKL